MTRFACLVLTLSLVAAPAFAQDGSKLFAMQCKVCHAAAASSPMGPALAGAAGGPVAARADFKYSPALKAKGGVWSDDRLEAFLTAPAKFAPGTRMAVAVAKPEDRAALIAYLKTLH